VDVEPQRIEEEKCHDQYQRLNKTRQIRKVEVKLFVLLLISMREGSRVEQAGADHQRVSPILIAQSHQTK
jgi:hypothetical protein